MNTEPGAPLVVASPRSHIIEEKLIRAVHELANAGGARVLGLVAFRHLVQSGTSGSPSKFGTRRVEISFELERRSHEFTVETVDAIFGLIVDRLGSHEGAEQ